MAENHGNLTSQRGKKHVLVIPVPLQAHIAGILRHSIELARRGVTVTFVGLEEEITLLKTFEELQGLDFNLVSYKETGGQPDIFKFLTSARDFFEPIYHKLREDRQAGLPGPTSIIADKFLSWASDIAKQLKVSYYPFYACGAIFVRTLQAYPQLFTDGTLNAEEATEGMAKGRRLVTQYDGVVKIQGLPALEYREMLNSNLGVDFYFDIGNAIEESDGLIVNTFYELEAPQIDAIEQSWIDNPPIRKNPKLFLVGPISTAATFKNRSFVGGGLDELGTKCLQWLDGQPFQSVAYICLGSIVTFTLEEVTELAVSLEATNQRFLWVIKNGTEGALPPDFEARTRDRGLTVKGWVPQLQILQHPSVGGFVTHCGWNSIIESISCGVPMACWPQLRNDQFFNCRYLVDVLKIAVEVRPQQITLPTPTSPKKNAEFERAVNLLMSSEERNAMRSRVQVLQKKVEATVADGGASKKALDDLVESIPPSKVDLS